MRSIVAILASVFIVSAVAYAGDGTKAAAKTQAKETKAAVSVAKEAKHEAKEAVKEAKVAKQHAKSEVKEANAAAKAAKKSH